MLQLYEPDWVVKFPPIKTFAPAASMAKTVPFVMVGLKVVGNPVWVLNAATLFRLANSIWVNWPPIIIRLFTAPINSTPAFGLGATVGFKIVWPNKFAFEKLAALILLFSPCIVVN